MTHIKICGITELHDAIAAIEAGADMLGFNFYPPSPRSVSAKQCAQISAVLNKEFPHITLVGVFVNFPNHEAEQILSDCGLHLAQLHGDETPETLATFQAKAYKAFRGIPEQQDYTEYVRATPHVFPAFLLDASVKGLFGGSGKTTDWSAAENLAKIFPILLAGGLTSENVAAAISHVRPWGVDTASGVEHLPGKKDIGKMKAFVKAVRSAD